MLILLNLHGFKNLTVSLRHFEIFLNVGCNMNPSANTTTTTEHYDNNNFARNINKNYCYAYKYPITYKKNLNHLLVADTATIKRAFYLDCSILSSFQSLLD